MTVILSLLLALASPTLPTVDEGLIDQVVKPNQGKLVLLNFWATWCGPCREEFPDLVRLHKEHQNELVLVSISMDEPEDVAKAAEFLAQYKADFPAYIRGFKDFEVFVNAVDPKWMGGIPATFVFDRQGKRVFGHEGLLTYDELKTVVNKYR